jgi:RND superfamily putative drug exporter
MAVASGGDYEGNRLPLSLRRPRALLAVALVAIAVLAVLGQGVEDKLRPSSLSIAGTESARGNALLDEHFGDTAPFVVLLRGPAKQLDRQGPELIRGLRSDPAVSTLSPWDRGSVERLRPGPRKALIVVDFHVSVEDAVQDKVPYLERLLEERVSPPVRATQTGFASLSRAIQEESIHSTERAELIAIPILLIVLLLVFRSPVAAAIPLAFGAVTVIVSRGVLSLAAEWIAIDAFALTVCAMMGLALGVDYSLLMVSRFREEARDGTSPALAAARTVAATGPTIAIAGVGLSLAMVASALLLPGALVASVAAAVVAAAALSVASALFVTPAMLVLLGPRLERWSLPRRRRRLAPVWAGALARRPRAAVLPVVLLLFGAALLASTLDTEMESIELLPAGDAGRQEHEAVARALGPGWAAPYEIVVDGGARPVTDLDRLRALVAFERAVERDPGVASMPGLDGIARASRQLAGADEALLAQRRGMERLEDGLSRAHDGAAGGARGLEAAASGSRRLAEAVAASRAGAGLLAEGLRRADSGSRRLAAGVDRAGGGSERLARGTERTHDGARRLAGGLRRAREGTDELLSGARLLDNALGAGDEHLAAAEQSAAQTDETVAAALTSLREMTVGREDPRYEEALAALERAAASSAATGEEAAEAHGQVSLGLYLTERLSRSGERAQEGIGRLSEGAERLDRALARLATGSRRIDRGLERLGAGGGALSPAIGRIGEGTGHLAAGLGRIASGSSRLAEGLGGGADRSRVLVAALAAMDDGVERELRSGAGGTLARRLSGAAGSGYLALAAIDGSPPQRRRRAALLVSLESGGHAARMLVIPKDAPAEPRALRTRKRLERGTERLARASEATVLLGGPAAELQDLNEAFRAESGPARLVLALLTILILAVVMRSLTVPPIAALLNLLTVAATFGLMALLFNGALLGGPGFLDAAVIPATIVVIFGLAIDYEVFIFARMREEYERSGSHREAVARGLERTAPVVTGAALIMIVVFLAFATSPFATIRQFGVAQAIAVAIDAFLIRLFVIPAIMRWLGPRAWWMPRWLGGSRVGR